MVVIHFKKSEMNQFRWETSGKISVDELVDKLIYSTLYLTSTQSPSKD